MNLVDDLTITSVKHPLDTSEAAFGELRDSSFLLGDRAALNERLQEDGYLFMRGFHKRDDVLAARRVMVERLAREGLLAEGTDPMDAIIKPGANSVFRPDLTTDNTPLMDVLYGPNMMGFYGELFDEPALHYDFTWLRAMGPGNGSHPHCDIVYMGRGERQRLMTAWCPMGDVSLRLGGLMVLEGSNHHHEKLRHYLERDVDTYCKNGRHAEEIESGKKGWEWNGVLSKDPHSLQKKLGGRWLTTEFEAGDLLTFTMYTIHASLDNQSGDRIRFSSDTRYQPASSPADERWIGANPIAHGQAGKRGRIC
jgi:hypothetical protein